jgi:Zn-dependent protease with chaperone function
MPTFFEQQHVARRNTKVMVVLFVLAVVGVVVAMDAFIASIFVWGEIDNMADGARYRLIDAYLAVPAPLYLWGAGITFALIVVESIRQTLKLRAGGEAIAAAFGARRVAPGTRDPLERRLLNVVEEMAIASGVRVPAAYVLDKEAGINAFAAGFNVSNSIVAVTRGTLETLNRDELQGVIGHEFSHILNGDASLNIRMMGVLAGIVVIGSLGLFIIRCAFEADDWRGFIALFAIGVIVCIIGFTGLFFARMIKASVAREREFLADASSVQFTRNPDGIAGALDQIRASERGTLIRHRYAEEVSHMFFGQSIDVWFSGLFATHPPIDERIRRVSPGFQPAHYRKERPARAAETAGAEVPVATVGFAAGAAPGSAGVRSSDAAHAWGRSSVESAALVGTLDAGKLDVAQRLLATLPPELRERMQHADGACAVTIALLLAPRDSVMEEQLAAARAAGAARLAAAAGAMAKELRDLGPAFHLPVADLALPAIKAAPADARGELLKALEAVIHADRRVSLHEFVLLTLMRSQLGPRPAAAAAKVKAIAEARAETVLLLSLVAHAGCRPGVEGERHFAAAFRAGATEMGLGDASPVSRDAIQLDAAGAALEHLRGLAPLAKAVLVKGLFAAATSDGTIRVIEAELMRLVGAVLDCPLPPLLDDLDPAALAA